MPIIGAFPEAGFRVELERSWDAAPPWTYRGHAVTPDARWAMTALVSAGGTVTVEVAEGAPEGTGEKARLIVRAAFRHAQQGQAAAPGEPQACPPPRRIVRWRSGR